MERRFAVACFAFAVAIATSHASRADQVPMFPTIAPVNLGSFYVSAGGTVQRTEVGRFNSSFTQFGTQAPFISDTPKVTAAGPAITAGYVTDWQGLGGRPRVEGFFSFVYGRSSITTSTPCCVGFSAVAIDGSSVFTGPGFPSGSQNSLTTIYHSGEGGVRVKTDFAILPNLALTPGIGVLVGNAQQKARFDFYQTTNAGVTGLHFSEEYLDTWRAGGEASLDLTWLATPELSFNGGVSGAIYYQRTKLTGIDCGSNALIAPVCDGLVGTPDIRTFNRYDPQEDRRTPRLLRRRHLQSRLHQCLASGSAAWNLNTPGIRNPTFNDHGPASIRYDNTWSFGGFAMVTIPFGPR